MEKKIGNSEINIIEFYEKNRENFEENIIILDSPVVGKLSKYSYIMSFLGNIILVKDGILSFGEEVLKINNSKEIFNFVKEKLSFPQKNDLIKKEYFTNGIFTILGYDFKNYIEDLKSNNPDNIGLPDAVFLRPGLIIVKNEENGEFTEINYTNNYFHWDFNKEKDKINIVKDDIDYDEIEKFEKNMKFDYFENIVERSKEYIKKGDIFQANISQRFSKQLESHKSFELYKILRKINPSPFASYVKIKDFTLVSQSPERLVKLDNGIVETRPIAGTRRKKKDTEVQMERELILSEKEKAEHIMLVDLERNDIGRVCEYGSVKVDELMTIEKYSHVMHIVSNITGKLKEKYDAFDLIEAVFPGGTITGAPKIRSMEIIDELENTKRGFYTGSLGFIDDNGNMDLNIIIRSYVLKNERIYFQAGAGIVFDSKAEEEYRETINKARAMILALQNLELNNEKNYSK